MVTEMVELKIKDLLIKTKYLWLLGKEILAASDLSENKFRTPRLWSNFELRRFAPIFKGSVVNISGWNDSDKEGQHYREYFSNASEYSITNFVEDPDHGVQGFEGEIPLNLENDLPKSLLQRFDVAFSHTVLEHIFDVPKAFANICRISRNFVITVVPYIQQIHGINDNVGDYWRFTPLTMKKLHEENGLKLRYCSSNGKTATSSIYLFCIGCRENSYADLIPYRFDLKIEENAAFNPSNVIGANIIR